MRRQRPWMNYLRILLLVLVPTSLSAEDLPSLTVELNTGRTLRGQLDPRTDVDRLWLRMGQSETIVQRGTGWPSILGIRDGERVFSQRELIQLAEARRAPMVSRAGGRLVIPSSGSPSDLPAPPPAMRTDQRPPPRVAAIRCVAILANWDADVATDGLLLEILPIDLQGEPLVVSGVATVELFSMRRVDQDSYPRGRGRDLGLVSRWSIPVVCGPGRERVRLGFEVPHPEFDRDLAPFGLVHVQLAAPGQGVFECSVDPVRIRPFSPLRDALEQQTGRRFFPSEMN